jgi:hypothetical protein
MTDAPYSRLLPWYDDAEVGMSFQMRQKSRNKVTKVPWKLREYDSTYQISSGVGGRIGK